MVKKKDVVNGNKNILESIVFFVSVIIVSGIILLLIFLTFTQKKSPPDLSIQYYYDPTTTNKNVYHIILVNNGNETAENVKIETTMFRNNSPIEKSELEIEFSPKKSKREGWITFSGIRQSNDSVSCRVISYKKPN